MGWFWTFTFFIHMMRRSKTASENHSKNSSKINENWLKNEFRIKYPVEDPFWSHFGPHFGSILDPCWPWNRPESHLEAKKSVSGGLLNAASIFIDFVVFSPRGPAAGGGYLLPSAGVREPGTIFGHRSKKSCWESSPSHFFDNWPRKPPGGPSIEQYFILL